MSDNTRTCSCCSEDKEDTIVICEDCQQAEEETENNNIMELKRCHFIMKVLRESCDACVPHYWDELDKFIANPLYEIEFADCTECTANKVKR